MDFLNPVAAALDGEIACIFIWFPCVLVFSLARGRARVCVCVSVDSCSKIVMMLCISVCCTCACVLWLSCDLFFLADFQGYLLLMGCWLLNRRFEGWVY